MSKETAVTYNVEEIIDKCFMTYIDFTESDLLVMEFLRENYSTAKMTFNDWYLAIVDATKWAAEKLFGSKGKKIL